MASKTASFAATNGPGRNEERLAFIMRTVVAFPAERKGEALFAQ